MQFVFQPLVYGFLLVLVPLLVHLINLLRHRRQSWAAMEFLMESYRRHRRWVLLKQWLLLLCRMAAMAVLVAMLAQWISGSKWLAFFGERVTHHYVLLDDSYSMSDGAQGETAYQLGLKAVNSLVQQVSEDSGEHQITLLRWSRATLGATGENAGQADAIADLLARSIPSDPKGLLDRVNATTTTGLELVPDASLDLIRPLIEGATGDQSIVYLVSDFRRTQWDRPETTRTSLQSLHAAGAEIQLIDCVRAPRENLAIVGLQPEQEVWAAGVPLFVQVQVRNHGSQMARNVILKPRMIEYTDGQVTPVPDRPFSGNSTELPPEVIEQIAPGETATRRFQVLFPTAGEHVIDVTLPEDSVAADNRRACVLPLVDGQRVLMVDGDINNTNAFYLESALNPGTTIRTGLRIEIKNDAFLRDCAPTDLTPFATIVLLDVKRLDEQSVAKLEEYCAAGGGVCIFAGGNADLGFYNGRMFQQGKGMFPFEIEGIRDLAPLQGDEDVSDVEALNHPVFAPVLETAASHFRLVRIQRYLEAKKEPVLANAAPQTYQVVAKLRNGQPLVVDKPIGKGRVITVLTNLMPTWNSWPQDPTFVVFALRMVGYLASFKQAEVGEAVATPLQLELAARKYLPQVEVLLPNSGAAGRFLLTEPLTAKKDTDMVGMKIAPQGGNQSIEITDALLQPGIIEVWKSDLQGVKTPQNFARFVSASEGNLAKAEPSGLMAVLRPVPVKHRFADTMMGSALAAGLVNRNTILMALLLILLAVEQALAYMASFHPSRPKGVIA